MKILKVRKIDASDYPKGPNQNWDLSNEIKKALKDVSEGISQAKECVRYWKSEGKKAEGSEVEAALSERMLKNLVRLQEQYKTLMPLITETVRSINEY